MLYAPTWTNMKTASPTGRGINDLEKARVPGFQGLPRWLGFISLQNTEFFEGLQATVSSEFHAVNLEIVDEFLQGSSWRMDWNFD